MRRCASAHVCSCDASLPGACFATGVPPALALPSPLTILLLAATSEPVLASDLASTAAAADFNAACTCLGRSAPARVGVGHPRWCIHCCRPNSGTLGVAEPREVSAVLSCPHGCCRRRGSPIHLGGWRHHSGRDLRSWSGRSCWHCRRRPRCFWNRQAVSSVSLRCSIQTGRPRNDGLFCPMSRADSVGPFRCLATSSSRRMPAGVRAVVASVRAPEISTWYLWRACRAVESKSTSERSQLRKFSLCIAWMLCSCGWPCGRRHTLAALHSS